MMKVSVSDSKRVARVGAAVVASGLVLGTWSGPAAGTASGSSAYQGVVASGSVAKCYPGGVAAHAPEGVVPDDEPTATEVRAYERDFRDGLAELSASRRAAAVERRKTYLVKVHVHVLKPTKSARPLAQKKIARQLRVLNRSFAGKQSGPSPKVGFRFRQVSKDITTNKRWYKIRGGTRSQQAMMRRLNNGGKAALNLYFGRPKTAKGAALLGFGAYPWNVGRYPDNDGVVLDNRVVPGGGYRGYDTGDIGVHEVGHWLGLYHTFTGRCSKKNDHVRDTPAHRGASWSCKKGLDTCKRRGKDPVHNFMNYSSGKCIDRFTKGQAKRMRKQWEVYRH